MIYNYRGFGAQSRFPNGVYSITLYFTVGGTTRGIPTPVLVDDSISVPELHWAEGGPFAKVKYLLFPPGEMYPSPLRIAADNWPMTGEVVRLPGLGVKASVEPVILAPPVRPPPAPPLQPAEMQPAAPAPADAPVLEAVPTGQVTTVDITGAGPTQLPVYAAPILKPEIVPGPDGGLVVVVPMDQISNLPTMPMRVTPTGVPGDTAPLTYSAQEWSTFFTFPPSGRLPVNAEPFVERATAARGGATAAQVDTTDLTLTASGIYDAEGRAYPSTQPADTGTQSAASEDAPTLALPGNGSARAAPAKGGVLPLAAGAGAGFLVAGPVGAGVGAVIGFLIGRR
jgi:hypothetical protein